MGESWDAVEIHENGALLARLPFSIKKKYGMRILTQPALSQTLGPWIQQAGETHAQHLAHDRELFTRLIKKLPRFDIFRQSFHPEVQNWLPFRQHGFDQTTRYTYTIDLSDDEETIKSRFIRQHKSGIKKAEKLVTMTLSDDIDEFLKVNAKTYAAQGTTPQYSDDYVRAFDEELRNRGKRFILLARDNDNGAVHSGIYVAGDLRRMYLLMSGVDPELRDSRAGSLMVWESIREAKRRGVEILDFEGSMMETVESYERGFGSVQNRYHAVTKSTFLGGIAHALHARV